MNAITQIPTSVPVSKPNEQQLNAEASRFLEKANQIVVLDQAGLGVAAQYLRENKAEQKRLDDQRRNMVDPLNGVVKQINALFKPVTETLAEAERIVKGAVSTYQIAEQRRIAAENAAREELARKERERLEQRALKAQEQGKAEKAEALMTQAATTVAVVAEAPAKVAGISTRMAWVAEVIDVREVCRQIADGHLPPTIVDFKPVELNRIATSYQNTREFSGLRISQKPVVASR